MLFILLPILALAADKCVLRGIDQSSLSRKEGDPYVLNVGDYTIKYNVCGPMDHDGNAATATTSAKTFSLGLYSTQAAFTDNSGNGFTYNGGTQCRSGNKWSSFIYLRCDPDADDKTVFLGADFDDCKVKLQMIGKSMCGAQPKSKGLSGIAIVSIVVAVIVALVIFAIAVWCIVNFVRGKRGLEILPLVSYFKKEETLGTETTNLI